MDVWDIEHDPFIETVQSGSQAGRKMRTGTGTGVYGMETSGRVMLGERWDMIEDDEVVRGDYEPGNCGKGTEGNDAPLTDTNLTIATDVETWKRHWEDVEQRFTPRRSGSGRFVRKHRHYHDR
jgi:hypothetical protein